MASAGIIVNPRRSTRLPLTHEDQVIVLAEARGQSTGASPQK